MYVYIYISKKKVLRSDLTVYKSKPLTFTVRPFASTTQPSKGNRPHSYKARHWENWVSLSEELLSSFSFFSFLFQWTCRIQSFFALWLVSMKSPSCAWHCKAVSTLAFLLFLLLVVLSRTKIQAILVCFHTDTVLFAI